MFDAMERISARAAFAVLTAGDAATAMARAEAAITGEKSRQDLRQAIGKVYAMTIPTFAQLELDRLKRLKRAPSDEIWGTFVLQYLRQESGTLIRRITAGMLALVREVLTQGVAEGLGIEKMARRMRLVVTEFNRKRAIRIARTEVISASNAGTDYGAGQSGLDLLKTWLATTTDARTRETHLEAHEVYHKAPIPYADLFYVGGYACPYPASSDLPAHERINCRCTHYHTPVERWV